MQDDAQNRTIALLVAMGKYDDAIKAMSGKKFALAEGANLNVSEHWVDAHVLRGRTKLAARQYREALEDFQTAAKIPSNLPLSGAGGNRTNPELAYWTGLAYEGLGDHQKATGSWTGDMPQAAPGGGRRGAMGGGGFMGGGSQSYYQALCLVKLGQADKAKSMFQELVNSGQRAMEQQPTGSAGGGRGRPQSPRARSAMAHYTVGLGYLGLNETEKAKTELKQSLELNPDLLGARTALADLR
jgi:tetratricopeptide (TPR) repeat protein